MATDGQPWKRSKVSDANKMSLPNGNACGECGLFCRCFLRPGHIAADEVRERAPSSLQLPLKELTCPREQMLPARGLWHHLNGIRKWLFAVIAIPETFFHKSRLQLFLLVMAIKEILAPFLVRNNHGPVLWGYIQVPPVVSPLPFPCEIDRPVDVWFVSHVTPLHAFRQIVELCLRLINDRPRSHVKHIPLGNRNSKRPISTRILFEQIGRGLSEANRRVTASPSVKAASQSIFMNDTPERRECLLVTLSPRPMDQILGQVCSLHAHSCSFCGQIVPAFGLSSDKSRYCDDQRKGRPPDRQTHPTGQYARLVTLEHHCCIEKRIAA